MDVHITWDPVPNAVGYRVLRDGTTMADNVPGTTYVDDLDWTCMPPALAPAQVAASNNRGDGILVSWESVPNALGVTHNYQVVTLGHGEESRPSQPDDGAAGCMTSYQVKSDAWGDQWQDVAANVLSFLDTQAPRASLTGGTLTPQNELDDVVRFEVEGLTFTDGPMQGYSVRAVNLAGHGPSGQATGQRVAGTIHTRWERSLAEATTTFVPIPGEHPVSFVDASAPADGSVRHYRCSVQGEGTNSVVLEASGSRYARWIPDSAVTAMLPAFNHLYVGGSFMVWGVSTGQGAIFNTAATPVADPATPHISGAVYAAVEDGSGGWFVGGAFAQVAGQPVLNLVHINANHFVEPGWRPQFNGPVRALARHGDTLLVGGAFTEINGTPMAGLARLDVESGELMDGWPVEGAVHALAVSDQTLVAGGAFTNVDGETRSNLAMVDLATGTLDSWNVPTNGPVRAVAVHGDTLIVGGSFSKVNDFVCSPLARVQKSSAFPECMSVSDTFGQPGIHALVVEGNLLYVGGEFGNILNQNRRAVAAINLLDLSVVLNWDAQLYGNSRVFALGVDQQRLYLGGEINNAPYPPAGLRLVNKATGTTDLGNRHLVVGQVNALAISGMELFAGGPGMNASNLVVRERLAALDLSTGKLDSWRCDIGLPGNAVVNKMTADSNHLYVAGIMTQVNGTSGFKHLAIVDPETGSATSPSMLPNDEVASVVEANGDLVVAGKFATVGGTVRHGFAVIRNGTLVDSGWTPRLGSTITAMARVGDDLVVAEKLANSTYPQSPVELVRLSVQGGYSLVSTLAVWGGDVEDLSPGPHGLLAGGSFGRIDESTRSYVAEISVTPTLGVLDFNPGADSWVFAVASDGNDVLMGGMFYQVHQQPRLAIARLNADGTLADWDARLSGNTGVQVYAISLIGSRIVIGGSFATVGNTAHSNFVVLSR